MNLPRIQLPGGLSCTTLGLGTFGLGGRYERDETNDTNAVYLIKHAIGLGINLFDTAEVYGDGHSEEILGMAIQGLRDKVVIATKFRPGNSKKEKLIAACEASLRRLQADVIDIYQMHWPNPAIPLEETMAGFEQLVKAGKVRAIGFSNTTSTLMKRAVSMLPDSVPVVSSQQEYNLAERFVERSVLPFCQSRSMALLAYSPLAQGKLLKDELGKKLSAIAQKHGTTAPALALQWLIAQKNTIAIPMTSNIKHLESNMNAATTKLSTEAITEVGKTFQTTAMDIPVKDIDVVGSLTGKAYANLSDARMNTLKLSPSPVELSRELSDGELLKPVKVRRAGNRYELYEGQLRYWAWRIAHDDKLPIPAQVA